MRIRHVFALLALAIAGCGGGGGGGGNNNPPPTPPPSANTPQITTQPASQNVAVGAAVSFSVQATGNGTLSYAWRFNGTPVAGATAATFALPAAGAALTDAGTYDVVVTNTLNGTTASATSSGASLAVLTEPSTPALTGEDAVITNSTGHVVSAPAQTGSTYAWTVANGTITAGQGTREVTYSAGRAGRASLTLTVTNVAGKKVGIKNVVVAASLPIDTFFSQPVVHPGSKGVAAGAPSIASQTYTWSAVPLTASATINGSATARALSYDVGNTTGTYQLSLTSLDQAARTTTTVRTLSVSRGVFLQDLRDSITRSVHTATALNDGTVLLVGGDAGVPDFGAITPVPGSQSFLVGRADLFDPVTQTFASVGTITPRLGHSATLLEDGSVLVLGGATTPTQVSTAADLYDPTSRTWIGRPALTHARMFHTATLLADGRVLVVGGVDSNTALATAEIYDPVANSWASAGTMSTARTLHSATRLLDGKVLVVGGRGTTGGPMSSAEIYNPATNTWTAAANAPGARNGAGAALLPSGDVLVLGDPASLYKPATNTWDVTIDNPGPGIIQGISATTAILLADGRVFASGAFFHTNSDQEGIYDPIKRVWTSVGGREGSYSTATALLNGKIFELGGIGRGDGTVTPSNFLALGQASLFDPVTRTRSSIGSGGHSGADEAIAPLTDGRVLVVGGVTSRVPTTASASAKSDLYNPIVNQWLATPSLSTARAAPTATTLPNNQVLVAGGNAAFVGVFATAERYDAATNSWSPAGAMTVARYKHTASRLDDGRVLVAGGADKTSCNCTTFQSSVDLYDPATNAWTATSPLGTARYSHTATRISGGRILVVGGFGGTPSTLGPGGAPLATAEIYDPSTGNWLAAASMSVARTEHAAIVLSSGRVLVVGGTSGSILTSAEIYDPTSNTWTAAAPMAAARQGASIAALSGNRAIVMGGFNGANSALFGVQSAEIYDAALDQWTTTPLTVPRQRFAVQAVSSERVMIVGGFPNGAGLPEFFQ